MTQLRKLVSHFVFFIVRLGRTPLNPPLYHIFWYLLVVDWVKTLLLALKWNWIEVYPITCFGHIAARVFRNSDCFWWISLTFSKSFDSCCFFWVNDASSRFKNLLHLWMCEARKIKINSDLPTKLPKLE